MAISGVKSQPTYRLHVNLLKNTTEPCSAHKRSLLVRFKYSVVMLKSLLRLR